MTNIPKGNYTINFQFKDTLGFWSVVTTDTIQKVSSPIADFTENITANCDSTTITFNNNSIDGDSYYWDFGDGYSDTIQNPTFTYYSVGQKQVRLTITDTLTQQSNTKTKVFDIIGHTYDTISIAACHSFTSLSGNYIWTTSGIYSDTITNYLGCDSIISIDLTINPIYALSDTIEICSGESYTFHDGFIENNITENISHTSNLTSINSCDSIITTHVNVININTSVNQDSNYLTSNQENATYRWLNCDSNYSVIEGETNQLFIAPRNGSYAVEITINDCIDTSSCILVTTLGINDIVLAKNIILYPNPTDNILNINLNDNLVDKAILFDILGREVKEFKLQAKENSLFVGNLKSGVYIIKCFYKDKIIHKSQFIKVE